MSIEKPEDFYRVYDEYKAYERPGLKPKHIRWFDREFWQPCRCTPDMAFLEIGCGTGQFLDYLRHKGAREVDGVELDRRAVQVMNPELAARVRVCDVWDFLADTGFGTAYDRIVLLDVLEHFSYIEAAELLGQLASRLRPSGMITVRVPNMASPWGRMHQFGDLTHKSAYTPESLKQLAAATGYRVRAVLAQRRGSPVRRFTEDCLHGFLSLVLTASPAIWTPNMILVLERSTDR